MNAAGTSFSKVTTPPGATYTMAGASNTPYVLAHFDHQSQRVRLEIVEAASGKSWHRALDLEHLGRNSTSTGFFALPWDGVTVAGNKSYLVLSQAGSFVRQGSW